MKKTVYIQPKAETLLLHEEDVVRTSDLIKITGEVSIDDNGIPKKGWIS